MKSTLQSTLATTALTFAMLAGPVQAGDTIYKWVDEKGVTQYGSRPPAGHTDRAKLIKGQSFSQSRRPGSELYEDGDAEEAGEAAEGDTEATETGETGEADVAEGEESGEEAGGEGAQQQSAPLTKEEQEQIALETKIKAHNCQKARQTLKVLAENTRVQVKDDKGNLVFMTAPQMEERKKQAEQVAADNCN